MGNFRKLVVWQKAKELVVDIYKLTHEKPFAQDFRFRDQIRSSAVSVVANIAEGDELDTNKQSIRHFFIAKGSTAELMTYMIIASEIGYLPKEEATTWIDRCEHISSMLNRLIQSGKNK